MVCIDTGIVNESNRDLGWTIEYVVEHKSTIIILECNNDSICDIIMDTIKYLRQEKCSGKTSPQSK